MRSDRRRPATRIDDWALDLDEVAAAIRPNTRVVSVNFPNNPTGKVIDAAEFARLAALCDERGIHLFSDEVYRGLELDPAPHPPPRGRSLADGAVAQRHVEVARAAGTADRLDRLPGPGAALPAGAREALHDDLQRRTERDPRPHRCEGPGPDPGSQPRRSSPPTCRSFDAFFAEFAGLFEWQPPDGGCVAYPRYLVRRSREFCARLVEEAGVLLLPASIYRSELTATPADHFRVGVGRRDPEPALEAFASWLRADR